MKLTVQEVLPMVQHYYSKPGNSDGGSIHLVIDDGNVEDRDVIFCIEYANAMGDAEGVALATTLLQMTKTQRLKLVSKKHNNWEIK